MTETQFNNINGNFRKGLLNTQDIRVLLESYIFDRKGKKIDISMDAIMRGPDRAMYMMDFAIDYYCQRFNVSYFIK
jgi:hypothetical protein